MQMTVFPRASEKKLSEEEDESVAPLAVVKKPGTGHAKSASQETASSSSTRHKKSGSTETGGRARDATIVDAVVVRSGSRSRSRARSGGKETLRSPDGWATREHIELVRSPTGRTYL